jgi:hypothetical protein
MLKWLCFKMWIVHELDCVTKTHFNYSDTPVIENLPKDLQNIVHTRVSSLWVLPSVLCFIICSTLNCFFSPNPLAHSEHGLFTYSACAKWRNHVAVFSMATRAWLAQLLTYAYSKVSLLYVGWSFNSGTDFFVSERVDLTARWYCLFRSSVLVRMREDTDLRFYTYTYTELPRVPLCCHLTTYYITQKKKIIPGIKWSALVEIRLLCSVLIVAF